MSERRLAAIMFTDIVGYTALMGKNEEQALRLLQKNSNIHKSLIKQYQGEFIKDIGDAILASFTTNANAVRCAIAIQQACWKEEFKLRIGIHEGDLVFEKGDAWGDGVNIASRLQELAEEGGIMISSAVYKDIKNKADINAVFVDEKILKNVEESVKVYQVKYDINVIIKDPGTDIQVNQRKFLLNKPYFLIIGLLLLIIAVFIWYNLPEKSIPDLEKSIAVIPFKNLSSNPDEQYLADGMMDAIINHLQKIKELEVRSRTSVEQFRNPTQSLPEIGKKLNVNYIIEGSFQKVGEEANLVVQLIITKDDKHLWAKEYKRDWSDIFSVQSEVAHSVAIELKTILTQEEQEKIHENPTNSLYAYDYYLRGNEYNIKYWFSQDEQDFKNAIRFYRYALSLDPEFTQAYADMSWTFWWRYNWRKERNSGNYLDSAMDYCNLALSIDPDLSDGYTLRGLYYTITNKEEDALEDLHHAINLNPNDARAYRFLGLLYHQRFNYEQSIINYIKAEKLEHDNYELLILKGKMTEFYLDIGDYNAAESIIGEMITLDPDHPTGYPYMWLGWMNLVQGKFDKAIEAYQTVLQLFPDYYFFLRKQAETYAYLKRFSESEEYWIKAKEKMKVEGSNIKRYNHRYAYTLWMNGSRRDAQELFDEFISDCKEKINGDSTTENSGVYYNLAGTYSFLGNKEEALKWLRKQEKEGFTIFDFPGFLYAYENFILYDPLFENIRNAEEFKRIVARAQEKKASIRVRIDEIEKKGI
jgi:TolB-like protein/Tfp pilus assembly protein PilF